MKRIFMSRLKTTVLGRKRLLPLAALSLMVAPSITPSAAAQSRDVDLSYSIYVGGFQVASLKIDLDLAAEDYNIAAKVSTTGMIGRMFPWWMKAYSRGEIVGSGVGVVPVSAGQRNNWRGRERFIDMKFTGGIARIDKIAPKPETDDRDRVPVAMRTGVVDLASAIVSIIRKMDGDQACAADIPVFDGRRRYDLVSVPDGSEKLKPSGYTPFVGETVNCIVSVRKKAGFKKNDDSGWNDKGRSARVWMGKAFGDVPPVPVRLTLNTPLGALIAHLSAAEYASGAQKVKLGQ
jgi:hypothetical protein